MESSIGCNSTVLISGGGHDLGAALASVFGERCYRVVIIGRSVDLLKQLAGSLSERGVTCGWYQCDITDWSAIESVGRDIEQRFGPVDVLVNNAGGWLGETIENAAPEALRALLNGCVLGAMYCSKVVLPGMKKNRDGFILNIGSTSGLLSSRDSAAASSPKAAINLFTHTLAREVAGYGVRVAVLHPSHVSKNLSSADAEAGDSLGTFKYISQRQVADVALYMVEQPRNVLIREAIVMPSSTDL